MFKHTISFVAVVGLVTIRNAIATLAGLFALLTFTIVAQYAGAAAIGVNIARGISGTPHDVTGTAGVNSLANWNNLTTTSGTIALQDASGTPNVATLNWGGGNGSFYGSGITPTTEDARLMAGYKDVNNFLGQNNLVYDVTGLGAPFTTNGYHVFVYVDHDTASGGTKGITGTDLTNSDTRYLLDSATFPAAGTTADYVQSVGTTPGTATAGNYVILDNNFSGSTFELRFIQNTLVNQDRSMPTGFSIVAIPEPATFTSIATGLLGLLFYARRRRRRR